MQYWIDVDKSLCEHNFWPTAAASIKLNKASVYGARFAAKKKEAPCL